MQDCFIKLVEHVWLPSWTLLNYVSWCFLSCIAAGTGRNEFKNVVNLLQTNDTYNDFESDP